MIADASERQRVIDAANWIADHAGWRAITNPTYIALLVVLTVALVDGADLIRIVAVGVVVTLALPLATSRLARRARRTLQANGEAHQRGSATWGRRSQHHPCATGVPFGHSREQRAAGAMGDSNHAAWRPRSRSCAPGEERSQEKDFMGPSDPVAPAQLAEDLPSTAPRLVVFVRGLVDTEQVWFPTDEAMASLPSAVHAFMRRGQPHCTRGTPPGAPSSATVGTWMQRWMRWSRRRRSRSPR